MGKKYKFPSHRTLNKMRKKLNKIDASRVCPRDAKAVEKAKFQICEKIIKFMLTHGMTQREMAKMVDIPETRVSEIVHYHIEKFTLDRLISYYELINPTASLKIAFG